MTPRIAPARRLIVALAFGAGAVLVAAGAASAQDTGNNNDDNCYPDCENTTTTGMTTTGVTTTGVTTTTGAPTTTGGTPTTGVTTTADEDVDTAGEDEDDDVTTADEGGSLPVTGGDVVAMAVVGTVLTGAGLALVLASRRREEHTA